MTIDCTQNKSIWTPSSFAYLISSTAPEKAAEHPEGTIFGRVHVP